MTHAFRSPRSLLEWHFSTYRLQSPQAGGSGGGSDAHSLAAKAEKRAKVSLCWSAVVDKTQRRVLTHAFAEGLSETLIANRYGQTERTVGRHVRRGLAIVKAKAVELRLMADE